MNKMKFQPIDLQALPRGEMFYYFSKMAPTGYSLTVSMDVTKLRQTPKEAGLKFFPSVEAGAFREEGGKVWMPLSLTCHHAATDGYHVHLFLQALQKDMDIFAQYL